VAGKRVKGAPVLPEGMMEGAAPVLPAVVVMGGEVVEGVVVMMMMIFAGTRDSRLRAFGATARLAGALAKAAGLGTWGVGPLNEAELDRGDAGARDAIGRNGERLVAERQAAQCAPQRLERQAGVDERAKHHVAGHARETIEVEDAGHGGS